MIMDKRYQVFVSSTYEDLREERQEVMQALLELDSIPSGMELFPAANEDQWTLIKGVIDDCDYYLVVIGGRYGSVGPAGISYTQMEYEYAVAQGKPVIAFLHKDPGALPAKKCEKTPEGKEKLDAFRDLAQEKMCRYWTSSADLGSVVSRSLVKLIKTHPAVGWVRADLLPDQSTAEEMLRLRKRIEELENSLGTSPAGTEHLSQGDDSIELNFSFGAFKDSKSYAAEAKYRHTFHATWNELFAAVSPLLIDEASDGIMKQGLDGFVAERNTPILQENDSLKNFTLKGFSLLQEDFDTVKVQLLALKLISKSTKKKTRSVSDRNAYWMLTPYGESIMISLRAIKKTP
jgi:hypothetical protein